MALFKILKGPNANLPTASKEGWIYVTEDTNDMHIFISDTNKIQLNANYANALRNSNNTLLSVGEDGKPVYFVNGKPVACTKLSLDIDNSGGSISVGSISADSIAGTHTGTWSGNTIAVGKGGTGKTSWTKYGLVYASAATTLASLGVGTSGYVLTTKGSSAAPAWVNPNTLTVKHAATAGEADTAASADLASFATEAQNARNGVYYVEGDADGTAGAWTGTNTDIPSLYTGLVIAYKIGTAGSSDGTTLNLTTAAGASGAIAVYRNSSTTTTHLGVGTVVLLTYDGTGWCWHNYDANTRNTVGDYRKNGTKLYFVGTTSSDASTSSSYATSYTNSNIYVNTSNQLYSSKGFLGNLTGDVSGNATSADTAGHATTADSFAASKNIALTGDITGSASSTGGWSIATTLANSGVTAGTYGPTDESAPAHGEKFIVPYLTIDAKGRVTSAANNEIILPTYSFVNKAATLKWNEAVTIATIGETDITVKLPTNPNSDTKVTQTVTTQNTTYPLLLAPAGQTATSTTTAYFNSGVTLNPSTNTIAANISGTAAQATNATNADNAVTATMATKLGSATVGSATQPIYLSSGTATKGSLYAGGTLVTLNNTQKSATTASFYAPTSGGDEGYILVATSETTEPEWTNPSSITVGSAANAANATLATTATRLNNTTAIGSDIKPVYFNANGVPVAGKTYAGGTVVTLNGSSKAESTASFYAPTSAGTSNYLLKSNGSGAPTWIDPGTLSVNSANTAAALMHTLTVAGKIFNGTSDVSVAITDFPAAANTDDGYVAGYMTATDKEKLDGITASADSVSFSRSLSNGTKVGTITINGTATDLYCQTNTNTTYSLSGKASGNTWITTLTPSSGTATTSTVPAASTSAAGLMSADMVSKLAGISTGANKITLSDMKTNGVELGKIKIDDNDPISIYGPSAADLGLSSAMKFLGTSATAITDGATTNPITIGSTSTTVTNGNVVLYGSKEFVWTGSAWEELGNEGSYKIVQTAVSSPTASGKTISFIDTISQDTNGKITVTKKYLSLKSTSNTTDTAESTSKCYAVGLDSNGQLYVKVPWVDNNTAHAHTAGTGLTISGSGGTSGTTTYSLAEIGSALTTGSYGMSTATTGSDGTQIYVPYITVDKYGRVTSITHNLYTSKNTTYSLSGLGGIGTISASGTAPLNLSASKSGTAVTITGSLTTPTSGSWFNNGVVRVGGDGVAEYGRYIDFHYTSASTNDYDVRIDCAGNSKNTLYLPAITGQVVVHTNDTAIGSATQPVYIAASGAATECTLWGKYVTLDTDQTITGAKTFSNPIIQGVPNTSTTLNGMNKFEADLFIEGNGNATNTPSVPGFYLGKSQSDENRHMDIVSGGDYSYIDFNKASRGVDYDVRLLVNVTNGLTSLEWGSSSDLSQKIFDVKGAITATSFTGPLYGNATTADLASVASKLGTSTVGGTYQPIYLNTGTATAGTSYAKAIKGITRSGTTFTYTCIDGTTGTFTQQDNNTTYTFTNKAATLNWNTTSTIATVGGTDITVKLPANPNTNTTYSLSKSGSTITLTGSDGSTTSVTDSDTNTTYTLSGLGGVGSVSASGTAPLTLSASKSGTAVTITGSVASASTSQAGVVTTGTQSFAGNKTFSGTVTASKVYGAVWNDYAEFRISEEKRPGRVIIETGDGSLKLSTERLQPGANVISDTYGFAIGQTEKCQTPIAVSGRVLVYPYEDKNSYAPGDAVCTGPNGTISKMTREEIREYPERIVGTVSEIPEYDTWGTGNVPVNGRIWIKVK